MDARLRKFLHLYFIYDKMLKAQNTHVFGVCRRVQVKLMEANEEEDRGQKQK